MPIEMNTNKIWQNLNNRQQAGPPSLPVRGHMCCCYHCTFWRMVACEYTWHVGTQTTCLDVSFVRMVHLYNMYRSEPKLACGYLVLRTEVVSRVVRFFLLSDSPVAKHWHMAKQSRRRLAGWWLQPSERVIMLALYYQYQPAEYPKPYRNLSPKFQTPRNFWKNVK